MEAREGRPLRGSERPLRASGPDWKRDCGESQSIDPGSGETGFRGAARRIARRFRLQCSVPCMPVVNKAGIRVAWNQSQRGVEAGEAVTQTGCRNCNGPEAVRPPNPGRTGEGGGAERPNGQRKQRVGSEVAGQEHRPWNGDRESGSRCGRAKGRCERPAPSGNKLRRVEMQ
jgi:hypothetical protein